MKLSRIARYDMSYGYAKALVKYCVCVAIAVYACLNFWFIIQNVYILGEGVASWKDLSLSFADVILYCFGGMRRFDSANAESFFLPITWFILNICILYTTLQYPYRDLSHMGIQVIIRCKSKRLWWFSKCFWNTVTTITSFLAFYITMFLFCLITGTRIELSINAEVISWLYGIGIFGEIPSKELLQYLFILPIVVGSALSVLQMTLTMLMKPFLAFLCSSAFLLANAYIYSPWLIGNYTMPIRSVVFWNTTLTFELGILLGIATYILVIFIGGVIVSRKDLLSLEK